MALNAHAQVIAALLKAERTLVVTRKDWTPDGIAAALALQLFLAKRGKKADVLCDGFAAPKSLAFLPGVGGIKAALAEPRELTITLDAAKTKVAELRYDMSGDKLRIFVRPKAGAFSPADVSAVSADFPYDGIVTLDAPDYHALGKPFAEHAALFHDRPVVNVDHDPANEQFGNLNAVDITATSACEALYAVLKSEGGAFLDADVATCLLTGIIAKTRSFRSPSVTPRSLTVAAELVSAGGRRDDIVRALYRTRDIATLKLWGRALARIKHDPETKLAWTVLVRQDFVHAGAGESDLPEVVEELLANAPEAEIAAVLYEQDAPNGGTTVCGLVSSQKHADSHGLVSGLNPEGPRGMARLCFAEGIAEAEKKVLASVRAALGKTSGASSAPGGKTAA